MNILLITADDMNYDTPAVVAGAAPGITPNIDRLASEGLRFQYAHVTAAVCQPSREVLMTGRYPHRCGATGFYPVNADVPTLQECLRAADYHLGILGKVTHLEPPEKFPWHYKRLAEELGAGRDPARYHRFTSEFLAQARAAHRPFFLMANSHDPHRPFAGSPDDLRREMNDRDADPNEFLEPVIYPPPARTYQPHEVVVPQFVPDLPDVRKEMAQYCSSAHRCDQSVGEILRALEESGEEKNTAVIFLSDNGMSFPFAKSNCYLTSTRSPWIVRWPGRTSPAAVDSQHFISGIDFMPTILDILNLPHPAGMDGRSFLPLLTGQPQQGRDHVFTVYHDAASGRHYPMRCLQTRDFGYIYNPWSNGQAEYRTEPMTGLTFPAMKSAAATDPAIAARVELLVHRVPEEFYNFQADPACLHNLIHDSAHQEQIAEFRQQLAAWMQDTHDPEEPGFRKFSSITGTQ